MILQLRALGWVLNLTRLNLILLLITTCLLISDQGHDLLISMTDSGKLFNLKSFTLLCGTLLWALSIWLWARVLLDITFPLVPVDNAMLRPYREHLPRALALTAFISVAINVWSALDGVNRVLIALLIEGALCYLLLLLRRRIGRGIANKISENQPKAQLTWIDDISDTPQYDTLKEALAGSMLGKISLATLCLGVILLVWGLFFPLSMGQAIAPLLLLMLWGSTILPFGSLLTYWGNKKGIPVITIFLIILIACSATNDNHRIRKIESGLMPDSRQTITQTLQKWQHEHCINGTCDPFILVTTAGGGIRAAYWTGTVLSDLHDQVITKSQEVSSGTPLDESQVKSLDDYLFAISGVSGGSVGATVYRTVVANTKASEKVAGIVMDILGEDYLGPIVAGLLYRDRIQRFLPFTIFSGHDRAQTFEKGLEAGFRKHLPDATFQLSNSFLQSSNYKDRGWPALFLNSTWSENGRRIVGATLRNSAKQVFAKDTLDKQTSPFLFKDLFETLGYDTSLSTAAHNSARFPYVSPAGSWQPIPEGKEEMPKLQRLQDGGLFENFGAETALELLERASETIGTSFKPVVILISSDPSLPENLADFSYKPPLRILHETLNTVHTLLKVRTGRGVEAAVRLKQWTEKKDRNGTFAYFRMCKDTNSSKPPLGWALSETAKDAIREYLNGDSKCSEKNRKSRKRVVDSLFLTENS
jgi:hypothetical protein